MEASNGQEGEGDKPLEKVKPVEMWGWEEKRVLEELVLESREYEIPRKSEEGKLARYMS